MRVLMTQVEAAVLFNVCLRTFQNTIMTRDTFPKPLTTSTGKRVGFIGDEVRAWKEANYK